LDTGEAGGDEADKVRFKLFDELDDDIDEDDDEEEPGAKKFKGDGKKGKGKGKGKDGKGKDGKGKDGKGKGNSENEVFVGGISFDCTEEAIRKDFGECGKIENLRMPLNEEGKPKGIAFLCFKTTEGVEAALKFDGQEYMGRTLKVNKAGEGKGKGKDGKDGKDKGKGNGKDKGKGKKGKKGKEGGMSAEKFAAKDGAMVESTGVKQTFANSDDE